LRLRIVHETVYGYEEPVTTSHHEVHLTPRDVDGQALLAHELVISPVPGAERDRLDYFKNPTRYFGIDEPHAQLRIVATSHVELFGRAQSLPLWSITWEDARERLARGRTEELLDAYSYVFDSPYVSVAPELYELARPSFTAGRSLLEAVTDLTHRIFTDFRYDKTATSVSTPLSEVLKHRHGVCQDFAHLEIGCLRAMGLAGRYVSGYILTNPPPGKPRLVGADASHAWVSTYLPTIGWVDFDPANDLVRPEKHVTVAFGRDFGDVTPVRGVILGGGRHKLRVSVDVAPEPAEAVPPSNEKGRELGR
jgi:transglutaminase-like putative cysteine protease